ncbi:MAG: amidohydrolase family protein [Rhodanobacteraceae bacterium]
MRPIAVLLICVFAEAAFAAPVQRTDEILIQGNPAGTQTVTTAEDGTARVEYSYNDRGRGDHIVATWKLDASGVLAEYSATGNDYMKAPVEERFSLKDGKATWKSRSESGEKALSGPAFYIPANAPPEVFNVLARALLKAPDHSLPLLPEGAARIEPVGEVDVAGPTGAQKLKQYLIVGLDFTPSPIWLDSNGNSFGGVSTWFSVVPKGSEAAIATLQAAQDKSETERSLKLARELARAPKGDLVIRNARLFDPRDLSVTPGTSVLIIGERVVRIAPDAQLKVGEGTETIDAQGRFLMPGLWDNHQHFSGIDGMLDLANGVTSARDMANDTDNFLKRIARFDDGTEIGPRVLKAGIIDGTGELAGPTKMRADTVADAIKDVDWYADHGYAQIKIYSSVKPELMPVIADRAHARGMRVSGHVPAFMSAKQFVEGGADEIQHLNFIELNFLYPEVKETRNRDRFIKVAERAREFTPDKPEVREFIAFLAHHHTVLDPTVGVFEGLFSGDPKATTPGLQDIVPRFPPQIRRALLSNALEVPKGKEEAYAAAFPAMLNLLKALHDAGVTIVPGTDGLAGYMLHHELELYVRAGIAAPEVLRMATLTSAQVMGVGRERGVIAPASYADMILIDGDPSKNIADIRNVSTVIKGGKVYDPAAIEKSLGIAPRVAR